MTEALRFRSYVDRCRALFDGIVNQTVLKPVIEQASAPPRRMSVLDPDHDWEAGQRVRISLDGVEQKAVEAYDVDAGTVTRPKLDEQGYYYVVGDEIARETVTGLVEVVWRD